MIPSIIIYQFSEDISPWLAISLERSLSSIRKSLGTLSKILSGKQELPPYFMHNSYMQSSTLSDFLSNFSIPTALYPFLYLTVGPIQTTQTPSNNFTW